MHMVLRPLYYALKAMADSVGVEQAAVVVTGATSSKVNVLSKYVCDLFAHRNNTNRSGSRCTVAVGQCISRDMAYESVKAMP